MGCGCAKSSYFKINEEGDCDDRQGNELRTHSRLPELINSGKIAKLDTGLTANQSSAIVSRSRLQSLMIESHKKSFGQATNSLTSRNVTANLGDSPKKLPKYQFLPNGLPVAQIPKEVYLLKGLNVPNTLTKSKSALKLDNLNGNSSNLPIQKRSVKIPINKIIKNEQRYQKLNSAQSTPQPNNPLTNFSEFVQNKPIQTQFHSSSRSRTINPYISRSENSTDPPIIQLQRKGNSFFFKQNRFDKQSQLTPQEGRLVKQYLHYLYSELQKSQDHKEPAEYISDFHTTSQLSPTSSPTQTLLSITQDLLEMSFAADSRELNSIFCNMFKLVSLTIKPHN